eukprot:gene6249-biopygen2856
MSASPAPFDAPSRPPVGRNHTFGGGGGVIWRTWVWRKGAVLLDISNKYTGVPRVPDDVVGLGRGPAPVSYGPAGVRSQTVLPRTAASTGAPTRPPSASPSAGAPPPPVEPELEPHPFAAPTLGRVRAGLPDGAPHWHVKTATENHRTGSSASTTRGALLHPVSEPRSIQSRLYPPPGGHGDTAGKCGLICGYLKKM